MDGKSIPSSEKDNPCIFFSVSWDYHWVQINKNDEQCGLHMQIYYCRFFQEGKKEKLKSS